MCLFGERKAAGFVEIVDVQLIRLVVIADVEIEVRVVVDVDQDRAAGPESSVVDSESRGDIDEHEASGLKIDLARAGSPGDENIGQSVSVQVSQSDAARSKSCGVEALGGVPVEELTRNVQVGRFGPEPGEQRTPPGARFRFRIGDALDGSSQCGTAQAEAPGKRDEGLAEGRGEDHELEVRLARAGRCFNAA